MSSCGEAPCSTCLRLWQLLWPGSDCTFLVSGSQHSGVNTQVLVCAGVLQRAVEGGAVGGQAGHL